jgi:RNA polymerase II subunit A small phosphatase-like protein
MAVTNTPHPPSSSTQATTNNTATTEESDTTIVQNEKDYLRVTDEASEVSKQSRGLLHVPSRSSSNKIQPSPTSTGLSGATASDPRGSIGGRSKESKTSILGRRRNGSTTSSKMSITPPSAGPAGNANPATSNVPVRSPKKKGFLSFLCCGVPDGSNTPNDPNDVPAKVTKIGAGGRPITASRPDNTGVQQNAPQTEKDAFQAQQEQNNEDLEDTKSRTAAQSGPNGELNQPKSGAKDQPLPDLPKDAESSAAQAGRTNPSVVVQTPTRAESKRVPSTQNSTQDQKDGEGDVRMEDPEPLPPTEKEESTVPVPRKDENTTKSLLPPPPPGPGPGPSEEATAPEPAEQKQQWLLPPIAPRFKGKKCLVLDLDETLVHSSFKVRLLLPLEQNISGG